MSMEMDKECRTNVELVRKKLPMPFSMDQIALHSTEKSGNEKSGACKWLALRAPDLL